MKPGESNTFRSRLADWLLWVIGVALSLALCVAIFYSLYQLVPDGGGSETRAPHPASLSPEQREAEREAYEDSLIEQEEGPGLSHSSGGLAAEPLLHDRRLAREAVGRQDAGERLGGRAAGCRRRLISLRPAGP